MDSTSNDRRLYDIYMIPEKFSFLFVSHFTFVILHSQGRKYDHAGNLRDWWAPGDGEEYERRASFMIK